MWNELIKQLCHEWRHARIRLGIAHLSGDGIEAGKQLRRMQTIRSVLELTPDLSLEA